MPPSSSSVVGGDGFWVALPGVNINITRCPGLVYTCQYNPNITNLIIFWQIHLEMSRGRRIFINDKLQLARPGPGQCVPVQSSASGDDFHQPDWLGSHLSVRVVGRKSGLLGGSDRSLYKKSSWAGKYFIQSRTACNLIIVSVMLHSNTVHIG